MTFLFCFGRAHEYDDFCSRKGGENGLDFSSFFSSLGYRGLAAT